MLDGGLEFGSSKTEDILGTPRNVYPLYPVSKWGSEPVNRVILDKLRSVMTNQGVPTFLWPEFIHSIVL